MSQYSHEILHLTKRSAERVAYKMYKATIKGGSNPPHIKVEKVTRYKIVV